MSATWNASMRQQRDADDGGEVMPGKTVRRHDVADIDREADQHDQGGFDQAHGAGEHDRRKGGLVRLPASEAAAEESGGAHRRVAPSAASPSRRTQAAAVVEDRACSGLDIMCHALSRSQPTRGTSRPAV